MRSKIEGHMLLVMNKPIHEEHLTQHLQTNKKQIERAITFLTGHNGIFNVTRKNKSFLFGK